MGEAKRRPQAEVPEPLPYDRALLLCAQMEVAALKAEALYEDAERAYRMAKKELARSKAVSAPILVAQVDAEFRAKMAETKAALEQASAEPAT